MVLKIIDNEIKPSYNNWFKSKSKIDNSIYFKFCSWAASICSQPSLCFELILIKLSHSTTYSKAFCPCNNSLDLL